MKHRKRSLDEAEASPDQFGVGSTLSILKNGPPTEAAAEERSNGDEWVAVKARKKSRRNPDSSSRSGSRKENSYPAVSHSPNARLQSRVRISDFQNLVLYLLADGPGPQWISVRNGRAVNKVVVVMVPGLEQGMFDGTVALTPAPSDSNADGESDSAAAGPEHVPVSNPTENKASPDDYYPVSLHVDDLAVPLKPLADIFTHLWPVKTPGDDKMSRMHSPLQAMLTTPLPKNIEEKQHTGPAPPREGKTWRDQPTPVSAYVATPAELLENDFVLHPSLLESDEERDRHLEKRTQLNQTAENGWIDLDVLQSTRAAENAKEPVPTGLDTSKKVFVIDCEMCQTDEELYELTRISVLDWDGNVVLDELVKPSKPITNYLTAFSGITKEKLDPVTTTLEDIQSRIQQLFTPNTILVGHSLNSDLVALKITHPAIVDTTILYPHPRGLPLKNSLKWLAQRYLSREIQKGGAGHDSVEDARAALDLVKLKCQRGPQWGTPEASSESIFKRLARSAKPKSGPDAACTGAVVDWGFPKRGYGGAADVCIGCKDDAEVVRGVQRAVRGDEADPSIPGEGVDFVWARMRGLEALRGWWNTSKTADNEELLRNARADTRANANSADSAADAGDEAVSDLGIAVGRSVEGIKQIYDVLPPCTVFIVYSGSGNPRGLARLHEQHRQFKKEYATKKWDQLRVHWTDVEEQALRAACRTARDGIGFVTVK